MGKRKVTTPVAPQPPKYREEVYTALSLASQIRYAEQEMTEKQKYIVDSLRRIADTIETRTYSHEPVRQATSVAHEVLWGVPNMGLHEYQRVAAELEVLRLKRDAALVALTDEERAFVTEWLSQ